MSEFAIIAHILDWRAAIAEVARVFASGGRFYFEEVTGQALARPSCRRLFNHPTADRVSADGFFDQCLGFGTILVASRVVSLGACVPARIDHPELRRVPLLRRLRASWLASRNHGDDDGDGRGRKEGQRGDRRRHHLH